MAYDAHRLGENTTMDKSVNVKYAFPSDLKFERALKRTTIEIVVDMTSFFDEPINLIFHQFCITGICSGMLSTHSIIEFNLIHECQKRSVGMFSATRRELHEYFDTIYKETMKREDLFLKEIIQRIYR